jgi:Uma2 family endonuclease
MSMPTTVPRYTVDDLAAFPDDGNRYELVDGILLVTPGPARPHQLVVARLVSALTDYLAPRSRQMVLCPGVVRVPPHDEMQPDVLVEPPGLGDDVPWSGVAGWWLAVEVSGRGSRVYDRDTKGPAYLALGVREYWRADLDDRVVYRSFPGGPAEACHADRLVWQPPEMGAPLVLRVAELFGAAPA